MLPIAARAPSCSQMDEEKIKKMIAESSLEEVDQFIDTLAQGLALTRRELARRKRLRAIAEERRESKMEGKDA